MEALSDPVPREALMRSIATLTTVASSVTIALARLAASRVRLKDVVPALVRDVIKGFPVRPRRDRRPITCPFVGLNR